MILVKDIIREAVYDWIRDSAPMTIKMSLSKEVCDNLIDRIVNALEGDEDENSKEI